MSQVLPILRWAAILGAGRGRRRGWLWAVAGFAVRPLRGRGGVFLLTAHPARRHARPDHGHAQVGAVPQRRRVRGDRVAALAGRGGPLGARPQRAGPTCVATNAHCRRGRRRRRVRRRGRSGSAPTASAGCWSRAGCSRRGSPRPASGRSGTRHCWPSTTRRSRRRRRRCSTRCAPAGVRWLVVDRARRPRVTGAAGAGPTLRYDNGRDRGLRADLSVQRGPHAHHPEARRHPGGVVDHVAVDLAERLAGQGDERLRPAYVLAAVVVATSTARPGPGRARSRCRPR